MVPPRTDFLRFTAGLNSNGAKASLSFATLKACGDCSPKIIARISGMATKGKEVYKGFIWLDEYVKEDVQFSFSVEEIGNFIDTVEDILSPDCPRSVYNASTNYLYGSLSVAEMKPTMYKLEIVCQNDCDTSCCARLKNSIILNTGELISLVEMFKGALPLICLGL